MPTEFSRFERIARKGKMVFFVYYPLSISIISTLVVLVGGFIWGMFTYGVSETLISYKEIYLVNEVYYFMFLIAIVISATNIFYFIYSKKRSN
ncbi:hypothetical protein [Aquibacillus kalidii]|uniref:hypothetical protein n=1 Tax=Aquibacillus kalidii TaxID=2762597 RepID=UPI001648F044|nr:hypothetical protein [Aquibacillus kalidii]